MHNSKIILIGLLVILVFSLIYCSCNKKKENYADLYYNKGLDPSILTRPSFNSNLDPNNPNMRFDSNVYGGFISGNSPSAGNLASYNMVASDALGNQSYYNPARSSKEGFAVHPRMRSVVQPSDAQPSDAQFDPSVGQNVGTVDAAQYVTYADTDYEGLSADNPQGDSPSKNSNGYGTVANDFASLGNDGTFQATKLNSAAATYKASLNNNYNPNTLKYTVPKDLLPAPDMRQPLARDPSDPSNFMYDRTVFAPLKKRNHNEADRFRGDLDIEPVKTGWFDIATVPTVDLVKGYFGKFSDIEQYQDLQDISYQRAREEATGKDTTASTTALSNLTAMITKDMVKPKLAYATQPNLAMPTGNAWGQKRSFAL